MALIPPIPTPISPACESQALALKPDGEGKSHDNSCSAVGEQPVQTGGEWVGPWGRSPGIKMALMHYLKGLPVLSVVSEYCWRLWKKYKLERCVENKANFKMEATINFRKRKLKR